MGHRASIVLVLVSASPALMASFTAFSPVSIRYGVGRNPNPIFRHLGTLLLQHITPGSTRNTSSLFACPSQKFHRLGKPLIYFPMTSSLPASIPRVRLLANGENASSNNASLAWRNRFGAGDQPFFPPVSPPTSRRWLVNSSTVLAFLYHA